MGYEEFKEYCSFMYESQVRVVYGYLMRKSELWLNENIPTVAYSVEVCKHIMTTAACIDLSNDIRLYEVGGQWQKIIQK